ncbi:hypothetical protein PspLS_09181 [Pyricularia sp. CBS 133598]|nr:hypothetical protein PspLS_09181 [Pyricularia sp. CBS 133598]
MLARRGHSQTALQSDKKLQDIHNINHFSTSSDMTPTASMMGQISPLLQLPSPPAGSYNNSYLYADADHYIDAQTSASQSPINSQYDMSSYVQDFCLGDVYPSPEGDCDADSPQPLDGSSTSPSTTPDAKAPAKRKRENRYKNAPPSVLSRRRAQNRASQRAYRERKDQRIKDLEQMLNDSKQRNDLLSQAYQNLHGEYTKLRTAQELIGADRNTAAASYDFASFDPSSFDLSSILGPAPTTRGLDIGLYAYPDITSYGHI